MQWFPIHRLLILMMLSAQTGYAQWYRQDAGIMGTPVYVEFWQEDVSAQGQKKAQSLIDKVFSEMRRIDAAMSPFKNSSELSKVNRLAGRSTIVLSKELYQVIAQAVNMSKLTGGAFDISFATIGKFYDYGKRLKPDSYTITSLLPAVNYEYIKLNRDRREVRFSHPKLTIDLGGIAKGYAVDRAISILRKHGIAHAYVSAGGDGRLLGDKRGRPWMVGIQDPRDKKKLIATLPLSDVSISTSGDYERYFVSGGERYHHILNPKTGRSADKVRSVTVIGTNCMNTDALSTGVFVLGVKKGLALISEQADTDVVIVDNMGRLHFSKGLVKNPGR